MSTHGPLHRRSAKFNQVPTPPKELPLRAKSVCLSERPRSKYTRNIHSADNRRQYTTLHQDDLTTNKPLPKRRRKLSKFPVKLQKRTTIEKVPAAIAVQNLSIPMEYAEPCHSTSKTNPSLYGERIDNKTKSSNPRKQVAGNERPRVRARLGTETENKLLLQISEARRVADFERILNSNAILCETAQRNVWRGCRAAAPSTAAVIPRPRSTYSLQAVSDAYYYLFQRHEESLQPLIDSYRQSVAHKQEPPPVSILQDNWLDNLQDLSEFYADDSTLKQKIDTVTDSIITEEIKAAEEPTKTTGVASKNFNVNLTDLIGLQVNGDSFSPVPQEDPLQDIDRSADEADEEKEWLASIPIMSESNDRQDSQDKGDANVDCLTQNLNSVQIESDGKVPAITFSNCCDGRINTDLPDNSNIAVHLAVPSIDSIDESRPPVM